MALVVALVESSVVVGEDGDLTDTLGNRCNISKGGEKCLMDTVEDLEEGEGDGDSVSEEALLPGPILG